MTPHATPITAAPPPRRATSATGAACILALVAWLLMVPAGSAAGQSLDELLDLDDGPAPEQRDAGAQPERDHRSADPEGERGGDGRDDVARKLAEMRAKAAEDYKEAANALEDAVQQMSDVSRLLREAHDTSLDTQRQQEQIIRKIEQMIAAAKQQQQQSSSSSSSSQQQRQQDSGTSQMQSQSSAQSQTSRPSGNEPSRGGPSPGSVNATGDTQAPIEELKQEWGQLPPRLRDELTEGLDERFSPVYRLMTEAYYRRLAEQSGQ